MAEQVKVLNNSEAAALIGVTPATLRFWRCKGRGPRFVKLGEAKQAGVAYLESDILAWRDARTFASTSAATVHHPGDA
ncbi:helix-turn-helix transcriptional regulator [Parapedomonas caeni]